MVYVWYMCGIDVVYALDFPTTIILEYKEVFEMVKQTVGLDGVLKPCPNCRTMAKQHVLLRTHTIFTKFSESFLFSSTIRILIQLGQLCLAH